MACDRLIGPLPDGCVDAVVTDPPFGISFAAQPTKWQRRAGASPVEWDDAAGDVVPMLRLAPIQAVWGGNYFPLPLSRGWLCWYKPDSPPSMGDFELAWTSVDQNAAHFTWSISATNGERVGHPTQKPLAVMLWTIGKLGNPQTILDPFCGSGTTLVAAKKLGRHFLGFEISPVYAQLSRDRLTALDMQPSLFEVQRKPEQLGSK